VCALRRVPLSAAAFSGGSPGLERTPVLPCAEIATEHLGVALLRTQPGGRTVVHHHGHYDTAVYVLEGIVRFDCGPRLAQHVDGQAGDFMFVAPYAVHQENNPADEGDNYMIVVRDTHGVALFPCDVPTDTPGGATGVHVIPAASAPAVDSQRIAGVAPTTCGARWVAMDRLVLAPARGAATAPGEPGESALVVLRGSVQVTGGGDALDLSAGDWLYVEPGTAWTAESAGDSAELVVIRCTRAVAARARPGVLSASRG